MTKTNNLIKKSRHVLIYLKDSMNTMDTNPNNSFKSDESNEDEAIHKMSELKEKLQEEIQEVQSQLAWSISNATRACEQALEQAEEEMEEAIEQLNNIVEELK